MVAVEDEIVDAGAEIIWVLERGPFLEEGTAELCMETMDVLDDPQQGWCVGDQETQPEPQTFDNSPFSEGRGFDIVVPRSTMEVVFTTNHGTPQGNENLDGEAVLQAVKDAVADL